MKQISLLVRKIINSFGTLMDSYIDIEGNRITGIGEKPLYGDVVDYSDRIAVPGFIDIHTHGYFGIDAMDSDEEDIHRWAKLIAKKGITSFIPTAVSSQHNDLLNFISKIGRVMNSQAQGEAKIIGARSEGPYINIKNKGAHNPNNIRKISIDEIKDLIDENNRKILKIIDMAPEIELFDYAFSLLQSSGILVSLGHSNADFSIASKAILSGIKLITHFYNGMPQFHHRETGIVGAGLLSTSTYLEIIPDFHHVSKEAIEIMVKIRGWDYLIAISDSLSIGGSDNRETVLGGLPVEVHDDVAWIKNTNTIAGSVISLNRGFLNLFKINNRLNEIVKATSSNAAQLLKLNDLGDILAGKIADINLLDNDLNVKNTLINGRFLEES